MQVCMLYSKTDTVEQRDTRVRRGRDQRMSVDQTWASPAVVVDLSPRLSARHTHTHTHAVRHDRRPSVVPRVPWGC